MDTEMTCYASFAEVTEDFYCSAVDVLKILVLRLHDYHEQYCNQHRHLPDCQKADWQDHLYRPCPFQPDRKRDNGGQNQAYAP